MESLAITIIGMIVAIITILIGVYGMVKSVKMTGVGVVV
jgi:Mg2+ and Co2+ transporter CorA